jgi:hypothetical protein
MLWFVIVVVAAPLIAMRVKRWVWRQQRQNAPTLPNNLRAAKTRLEQGVDSIEDGALASLIGTVRALDDLVTAPLSDRDCVSYLARADIWIQDGRGNRTSYAGEAVRGAVAPFVLETRHGPVLVTGEQVTVTLTPSPVVPRRRELESAFMRECGFDEPDMVGAEFVERRVEAGDKIRVAGIIVVSSQPEAARELGYRDTTTTIRITDHPRCPLTIGRAR